MKNIRLVALAAVVAAFSLYSAAPAGAKKGALVVGTDPAGDWGSNQDAAVSPAGETLGQDLLEASIGMADKATVNFVIKVGSLPPTGGWPEVTRYTWQATIDTEAIEIDGKFTNYSRGACDPTSNNCPPPRDPGQQPFLIRGNCGQGDAPVVVCEELGIVQATFDAATGTITIPVPLELIGAKAGSKIAGGIQAESGFGGVSAAPSAFYSHSTAPYDTLMVTKTFVVPRR